MSILEHKLIQGFETLATLCRDQAERFPDAKALIIDQDFLTYRQLEQQSNQLANALLAQGIKAGARVAILAQDCLESYVVLFACAKIKAVLVPINWRLAAAEVNYIINDAEVELLLIGSEFDSLVQSIQLGLIKVKTLVSLSKNIPGWLNYRDWSQQYSDRSPEIKISASDGAVQLYTSGTTGRPKGVQLANYSFFAVAQEWTRQGQNWMDWQQTDVNLVPIPFFHIGGLWWAIRGLAAGATNILISTFQPLEILKLIETHQVSKTVMVPAMIQVVLSEPQCQDTDFSSLKYILYGGSPIAESLLKQALATFECDFVQIYGMTETGNCAVCLPAAAHTSGNPQLLKSAGRPFPGVSVTVIDPQGNQLKSGQIGEICLKSPANMSGYWKLPEATAQTLVDGWVHTGDAGYIDDEGYIYICDRLKDMICYAGENVYPAEIENILYEHPAIAEVGVIGVPDPDFGEAIKAVVVLKPDGEAKALDIIHFVRGKLADFKLPRSIEFASALPRTPSGKIQKGRLRDKYWQGYERRVN